MLVLGMILVKSKFIRFIFFLFFSIIISNISLSASNYNGPTNIEEAKKEFFSQRKLDFIEGLWYNRKEGAIYAIVKTSNSTYNHWTVEHKIKKYEGTLDLINALRKTADPNKYIYKTTVYNTAKVTQEAVGSGEMIMNGPNNLNYVVERGCWETNLCWAPIYGEYIRVWPENWYKHNAGMETNETNTTNQKNFDKETESSINWKKPDKEGEFIEIPNANASVSIIESEKYIDSKIEIENFYREIFNKEPSEKDMIITNTKYGYDIYLRYYDNGYISLDDWKNVDAQDILGQLYQIAIEEVESLSWVMEPKIYENDYLAFSYEVLRNDGRKNLESKILSLNRYGYLESVIVFHEDLKTKKQVNTANKLITDLGNSISFKDGYRYGDYAAGDKISSYGAGGLIAGSMGIKMLAKTGILSKFIPFLLKFWWLIFAPFIFFFTVYKNKKNSKKNKKKSK